MADLGKLSGSRDLVSETAVAWGLTGANPPYANLHAVENPALAWLDANVGRPACNAFIADVYAPVVNVANASSQALIHKSCLPAMAPLQIEQPKEFTGEYYAQLVSRAAVSAFAYGLSAKMTGGAMRSLGTAARLEGLSARLVASEASAQILGGAIHDGLLDAPDNKTRLTNIAAGALSMAAFEGTNRLCREQAWYVKMPALGLTGVTVSIGEVAASAALAGKPISLDDMRHAATDAAVVSVLLPGSQYGLNRVIDAGNVRLGRGIPLERYLGYEKLAGKSPVLDSLCAEQPLMRVQPNSTQGNLIDHRSYRIQLEKGASGADLGHELAHKQVAAKFEQDFLEAANLLWHNEPLAKEKYVQARFKQEVEAARNERLIARDLSGESQDSGIVDNSSQPALTESAYRDIFEREFASFKESNGRWRPDRDYALVSSETLARLKASDDPVQIVDSLYDPGMTRYERECLSLGLANWQRFDQINVTPFEVVYGLPAKAWRTALTWKLVDQTAREMIKPGYRTDDNATSSVMRWLELELSSPATKFAKTLEDINSEHYTARRISRDEYDREIEVSEKPLMFAELDPNKYPRKMAMLNAEQSRAERIAQLRWQARKVELDALYEARLAQPRLDFRKAIALIADKLDKDPDWLADGCLDMPGDNVWQYRQALGVALIFGKNSDQFWRATSERVVEMRMPIAPTKKLAGLKDFLIRNKNIDSLLLETVAGKWDLLAEDDRKKACSMKFEDFLPIVATNVYPGATNPHFAAEAMRWSYDFHFYDGAENRFVDSLRVTEAFPTDLRFETGKLMGYFLKRDDPRAMFLGNHLNCCMRLGGANEDGVWWAQESPQAGFFVVEDKSSGELVAGSRVWRVPQSIGVCFNNVEAKGLGTRHDAVLKIYQSAANHLVTKGASLVTVGTGNSDLELSTLRYADDPLPLPYGYDGLCDCDDEQLILAAR
jgi:hypothetical protein